jgi:hemerythrin
MPLIKWSDDFELGIKSVDFEHRELIDLINALHEGLEGDVSAEAVSRFLGEIYARISAHFALEEKVMRDLRYDQYEDHKHDHDALLDEIREIMDEYEAGGGSAYEDRLAERLSDWFGEHFKTKDARLHAVVGP